MELKDYESAMKTVDLAIQVYNDGTNKDFVKLAKLFARKASVFKQLNEYKSAIEYYEKSLLEDN